jgi:Zn ribbon nucleic-acid-binding protein
MERANCSPCPQQFEECAGGCCYPDRCGTKGEPDMSITRTRRILAQIGRNCPTCSKENGLSRVKDQRDTFRCGNCGSTFQIMNGRLQQIKEQA